MNLGLGLIVHKNGELRPPPSIIPHQKCGMLNFSSGGSGNNTIYKRVKVVLVHVLQGTSSCKREEAAPLSRSFCSCTDEAASSLTASNVHNFVPG